MNDSYLNFANSAVGAKLADALGLPKPIVLERYKEGQPVIKGSVLIAEEGVNGTIAGSADSIDAVSFDALRQISGLKINGTLRGGKHDVWQGGFKVPFLVRWPGHVPAGTTSNEMIGVVDIFATVAAVVGAEVEVAAELGQLARGLAVLAGEVCGLRVRGRDARLAALQEREKLILTKLTEAVKHAEEATARAEEMKVRIEEGKKKEYKLQALMQTNQNSAFSQRPSVATGDKVKKGDVLAEVRGASWAPNGPRVIGAVDPDAVPAAANRNVKGGKAAPAIAGKTEEEIRAAAQDTARALMLIRAYRIRGHLEADLDDVAGLCDERLLTESRDLIGERKQV